jgi:hypothetical protein
MKTSGLFRGDAIRNYKREVYDPLKQDATFGQLST